MRLKIISDGTSAGTRVIDMGTGKALPTTSVDWHIDWNNETTGPATATVKLVLTEADIETSADVFTVCPGCKQEQKSLGKPSADVTSEDVARGLKPYKPKALSWAQEDAEAAAGVSAWMKKEIEESLDFKPTAEDAEPLNFYAVDTIGGCSLHPKMAPMVAEWAEKRRSEAEPPKAGRA